MNSPFFVAVANHLWQSTLVAIGIGVVTLIFRKNGASVRHALWLVASLKFLVPFAMLAAVGSVLVPDHPIRVQVVAARSGLVTIMQGVAAPVAGPAIEQFPATDALSPAYMQTLLLAAAVAWASGTLFVLARRFRQWMRLRALLHAATPIPVEFPVDVRSSPSQLEPAVVGVFRPALLVPHGLSERLTPAQMRAVLAHERCHINRRDNLRATLHMIVEGLFWFHPLVWWLGARLIAEREQACDEHVLREGHDPATYAEGILRICEHCLVSRLPSAAGVSGADLKQRIGGIMKNSTLARLSGWQKSALAALAGIGVLLPMTAGLLSPPRVHAAEVADEVLARRLSTAAWFMGTRVAVSAPDAEMSSFEVKSDEGDAYIVRNQTLRMMIVFAWRVNPSRIEGPALLDTARFDIDIPIGKVPGAPQSLGDDFRLHLQMLLRTRFGLGLQIEPHEMSGYVLRVADPAHVPPAVAEETPQGLAYVNDEMARGTAMPLEGLITHLSNRLDAPIIDETGLTDRYNYELYWGPGGGAKKLADPAQVDSALRGQLGLHLQAQEVIVLKITATHMKPITEITS